MLKPDERIALVGRLMRKSVLPALPTDEGAVLILFPFGKEGSFSYISTAERPSMRALLRNLLAEWDREHAAGGE